MLMSVENKELAIDERVNQVVMRVLSSLAPNGEPDPRAHKPLESYLQPMFDAVVGGDSGALERTVEEMRCAQISAASIAEVYVPLIAQRLGDAWVQDTLDFAAVTIGCARLQRFLRGLESEWGVSSSPSKQSGQTVLVGVAAGNQHTLGATVLAGQLRHRGVSVCLDLELTAARLKSHVINQQLSAVLLSASMSDDLASLRELRDICKDQDRSMPVVIGGVVQSLPVDIKEQTGADLVTQNLQDVIALCASEKTEPQQAFQEKEDAR